MQTLVHLKIGVTKINIRTSIMYPVDVDESYCYNCKLTPIIVDVNVTIITIIIVMLLRDYSI